MVKVLNGVISVNILTYRHAYNFSTSAWAVFGCKSADNTQGGYEYPFEGWSGTPIDFSVMSQTKEGLFKKGYVVDQLFNCNTGLITWEVFGVIKGEFRLFSERAIVVHKPQDECKARGFNPNS